MVACYNGECTHTQTITTLSYSSPPNPHDSTLHARKFKVNAHWQVRTHARQHKINSSLEISLQSKKDATSKSQAASLTPSVIVTSRENFTKYSQTDPEYTHVHSFNKSLLISVSQQWHQCCKSITHQCTVCNLTTARSRPARSTKSLFQKNRRRKKKRESIKSNKTYNVLPDLLQAQ